MLAIALFLGSCKKSDPVDVTGTVLGTVIDSRSHEPLRGVSLTLTPSGRTTTTGQDGKYEFANVEAGSYAVHASYNGYQTDKKDVTVKVAEDSRLDFSLQPTIGILSVQPDRLDFGADYSVLTFNIRNTGYANLQWQVSVGSDVSSWLTCSPTNGTTAPGASASVRVEVNRNGLVLGDYPTSIAVTTTTSGSANVAVTMRVAGRRQPPTVTTGSVLDTSYTSARIAGEVVDLGSTDGVTAYGHVWSTQAEPTLTTAQGHTELSHGVPLQKVTAYESALTGLTHNTIYNVRAYATNQYGTNYGETIQLTTRAIQPPTLGSVSVSGISFRSATFTAAVTDLGGGHLTDAGFVVATQTNPTLQDTRLSCGAVASLRQATSALQPQTTYYVRPYATNEAGTAYGQSLPFVTNARPADSSFDVDDYSADDHSWD